MRGCWCRGWRRTRTRWLHGQHRPQRADDVRGVGFARPGHHAAVPDLPGRPRDRMESHYKETSAIGQADQDLMASFMEKWQAGKVPDLQAGPRRGGQADQRPAGRRRGSIGDADHRATVRSPGPPRGSGLDARPAAASHRWPTVLLFMSPWIIGFSVFIVYPMVSSLYFSFTHYDLLGRRSGSGSTTTSTCSPRTSCSGRPIRNTVWFIVVAVPLQIVFAIATATLLTKPRKGVKVYRTIYLPAGDRTDRRRLTRLLVPVQSGLRARSTASCRGSGSASPRRGSTRRARRNGRS